MSKLIAELSSKTLLLPQSSLNQAMATTSFQLGAILDSLTLLFCSCAHPPFSLSPSPVGSTLKIYSGTHFLPAPLCPPVQTTISLSRIRQYCSHWCSNSTFVSPHSVFNSAARKILSGYVSSCHLFMQNFPIVPCFIHSKS